VRRNIFPLKNLSTTQLTILIKPTGFDIKFNKFIGVWTSGTMNLKFGSEFNKNIILKNTIKKKKGLYKKMSLFPESQNMLEEKNFFTPEHNRVQRVPFSQIGSSIKEDEMISGLKTVKKESERPSSKHMNSTPFTGDFLYKSPTSNRAQARELECHLPKRVLKPQICKKLISEDERKVCPVCMKELSTKGKYI
jgi:hypothetical protein